MTTKTNRSKGWIFILFWKGLVLLWHALTGSGKGTSSWFVSRDGAVFLCAFLLVLTGGSLWLLETMRLDRIGSEKSEQTAEGADRQEEPNPVVARIGTEAITLEDVLEFARQDGKLQQNDRLSAEEAIDRDLVEDTIDQMLLARAATNEGLISDPEVRSKLTAARNRILAAAFLEHTVEQGVTEQAARELYQAQRRSMAQGEEIRLRELVVADPQLAMDLSAELNGGASFTELINTHSIASSAADNGDLGYMPRNRLPDVYEPHVASLSSGLYTLPIETPEGWAIVKVEGRQRISPPPYERLEDELLEFLRLRVIDATIADLREKAEVKIIDPENPNAGDIPQPIRKPATGLRN